MHFLPLRLRAFFTFYPGIVESKHFALYRRYSNKIIMPSEDITDANVANDCVNTYSLGNKRHRCEYDDNKENAFKCKESEIVLKFAKLSSNAITPTRGSPLAAGFDLYSAYDYTVPAKGKEIVKTDIQIAVPDGCYGRVAPRSGLAAKNFIDVGAGVIDQDYRGNVGVVLFNFSDTEFKVSKGDRVAQLICERIYLPELVEAESLDETERGAGGFGSTGTN